jgi:hypothetical protein
VTPPWRDAKSPWTVESTSAASAGRASGTAIDTSQSTASPAHHRDHHSPELRTDRVGEHHLARASFLESAFRAGGQA